MTGKRLLILIIMFIGVGLVHVYPDIRFILEMGADFQGIPLAGTADENVYLSRIAGVVYRNDFRLANAGVYEHKNSPIFQPSLAEVAEGLMGKCLRLEAWQVDILATFIFPTIVCFFIYLLAKGLSGSFKAGVLASLAATLGYYWLTPNLKAILTLSSDYFNQALFFTRPISPQFHFIPFILSLYFVFKSYFKNNLLLAAASGIVTGLLFYTSIYYWTFAYAGLFVLLVSDLAGKKLTHVKNYLLFYFLSLLVATPYLFSVSALNRLPHFQEIFARGGGVHTHQPILPAMEVVFLAALIFMCFFFKEKRRYLYFMLSFVGGGLICLNQQVITGKTVEPMHWQSYTNKIFIIICFFACFSYIAKSRRLKQFSAGFPFYSVCFLFFALGITQQNIYYSARSGFFRELQPMAGILKYIHKKIPSDAVILTDPLNLQEERMISVFTKNYPYISDSFFITSAMADREVKERYLFALYFFGYTSQEAEKLFKYMDGGLLRGMQVHSFYGGTPEKNSAYIESFKKQYVDLFGFDALSALRKFKVDYLLLNKETEKRVLANTRIFNAVNLVFTEDLYSLYKIEPDE